MALATVLVLAAAACGLTAVMNTPAASAAGTVNVVSHVGGAVRAVYAADNYVLWGKGAELEVFSADGANRLGNLLLPAFIVDIDVDGAAAYVAARDGLYVVSLANLAQPALVRRIAAPPLEDEAMVAAVAVAPGGGYAYVGLADAGLWVVNTAGAAVGAAEADPAAPAVVLAPDHHVVTELYQFGNFLFSVDNFSGNPGRPRVWNISNPAGPADLGTVNTVADASGVAVAGGHLFISTFHAGLDIYSWDPAQPLNATLVGSVAVGAGGYDLALTADGQRALLVAAGQVALVDVSNRAAPVLRDSEPGPVGYYSRIAVRGGRAFVGAGEAALQVFSFDATTVSFAHERGLRGQPMAGAAAGNNVFVAAFSDGLVRLGAADPSRPGVNGGASTGKAAQAVAISGGYVLVGADDDVVVFDAASLAETGRLTLPDFHRVLGLAATADMAFVAAGHAGVCALTLSGGVPKLQSCLDTDGEALDVALDGTRLYVADSGNGVVVVNAANPAAMQSLGRYSSAFALDVAVAGTQLFVSDFNDGDGRLLLLNRGAGAALNFAAQFNTRGFVQDVETAGELVYAANQDGLEVLHRASATSLAPWAWYDSAGGATDAVLVGGLAYLMDGANGLVVLDVSAPGAPPTPAPGAGSYRMSFPLVLR